LHQRQAIRTAIQNILSGKTSAETRVFRTRFTSFKRNELPAIGIYLLSETSDAQDSAPREYLRKATVAIEGIVRVSDQPDDEVDDLAEEIETAMNVDPTLFGAASDSTLTATEMEVFENGDQHIGAIRLQYEIKYYSYPADDESVDLEIIDTKYNLKNSVEEDDQAEDIISLG
jgi:hypothetical protein